MEPLEHTTSEPTPNQPPSITPTMVSSASALGPWTRFFSIMAFIGAGFMLLAGLFMLVMGIVGGAFAEEMGGGILLIGMAALYIVLAAVYVPAAIYLFRCAGGAAAIRRGDLVGGMEQVLTSQRAFWKFIGIVTIVMLCLYPLLILVAVLVPILAGGM